MSMGNFIIKTDRLKGELKWQNLLCIIRELMKITLAVSIALLRLVIRKK